MQKILGGRALARSDEGVGFELGVFRSLNTTFYRPGHAGHILIERKVFVHERWEFYQNRIAVVYMCCLPFASIPLTTP